MVKIRRYDLEKISTKLSRKNYVYIGLSDESIIYLISHATTKHLRKYRSYKKKKVMNELDKVK